MVSIIISSTTNPVRDWFMDNFLFQCSLLVYLEMLQRWWKWTMGFVEKESKIMYFSVVSILPLCAIFQLDFETLSTFWYFWFFMLYLFCFEEIRVFYHPFLVVCRLIDLRFLCNVLFIVVCSFVLFHLVILVSILLRSTLLITHLVSSNSSY